MTRRPVRMPKHTVHVSTCQADGARIRALIASVRAHRKSPGADQEVSSVRAQRVLMSSLPTAGCVWTLSGRGSSWTKAEKGGFPKRKTCRGWGPGEDGRCPRSHPMPLVSWAADLAYSIDWQFRPSCTSAVRHQPTGWVSRKKKKGLPGQAEYSFPKTNYTALTEKSRPKPSNPTPSPERLTRLSGNPPNRPLGRGEADWLGRDVGLLPGGGKLAGWRASSKWSEVLNFFVSQGKGEAHPPPPEAAPDGEMMGSQVWGPQAWSFVRYMAGQGSGTPRQGPWRG